MVNRKKVIHKQPSSLSPKTDWLPLPAIGGVVAGLFLFFIIAEIALAQQIHGIHWGMAAGGALAGYFIGLFWAWRTVAS